MTVEEQVEYFERQQMLIKNMFSPDPKESKIVLSVTDPGVGLKPEE